MISVLIPTRKRVKIIDRALHSIWDMSSSEDAVEILLRCDEDDQETISYLEGIKSQNHNLQVLVGPRKDGFISIPSFMNDMAAVARGNLLMCCNDEAIFRTKNWDRIIEDVAAHYTDGIFDIGVDSILNAQYFVFSIISRRWVDIVGYLLDTRILWWGKFFKDISDALGRSIYIPEVIVEHDWAGFRPDVIKAEAQKRLSELVAGRGGWREEYQKVHDKAVAEAVEKLKPHLDPSIKPIDPSFRPAFAVRAICISLENMKPKIYREYLHIPHNVDSKPRLLIGRVIDIPKPKRRVGFYPRTLGWLDGKPVLKSALIRMGVRFIVGKLLNLIHRRRTQER